MGKHLSVASLKETHKSSIFEIWFFVENYLFGITVPSGIFHWGFIKEAGKYIKVNLAVFFNLICGHEHWQQCARYDGSSTYNPGRSRAMFLLLPY